MVERSHSEQNAEREFDHPGMILRDLFGQTLGLSISQSARDLGITRQTLHRVIAGAAAITPEMAARLERLCGVPGEFRLLQQLRYELQQVRGKLAPELSRIPTKRLPQSTIKKIGANHGC